MEYRPKARAVEAIQYNTGVDAVDIFEQCPFITRIQMYKWGQNNDLRQVDMHIDGDNYIIVNPGDYVVWSPLGVKVFTENEFNEEYVAID